MKNKDYRHIVDILFVISLFCTFVLSAIFLISIGANIYSNTMENMDGNFSSRTAVAYLTEKVHQSDENDAISVGEFEGHKSLILSSFVNDTEYLTYIYEHDGKLKELTKRSDISLSPGAGQEIIEIKSFQISQDEDGFISCKVVMKDNDIYDFYVCEHSRMSADCEGGTENEF